MTPAELETGLQAVIDAALDRDADLARRWYAECKRQRAASAAPEPYLGQRAAVEATPPFAVTRPYPHPTAGPRDHGCLAAGGEGEE